MWNDGIPVETMDASLRTDASEGTTTRLCPATEIADTKLRWDNFQVLYECRGSLVVRLGKNRYNMLSHIAFSRNHPKQSLKIKNAMQARIRGSTLAVTPLSPSAV